MTSKRSDSIQNVIANAPYSVALLDRQFVYLSVSKRWKIDFKLGDHIAGRCHTDIFRLANTEWIDACREALNGATTKSNRDEVIFPNGTRHWISWEIQPWYYEDDKIEGVLVYMELLVEEAEKEAQSRKMLALYEQTNEVARIGAWEVDLLKNEIYWSSITKQIHGVADDYVPNLTEAFAFFKEGSSRAKLTDAFVDAVNNGKSYNLELQIVTATGNTVWVNIKGNVEAVNGSYTRVYGTFQDIQAQKIQELQLTNSEIKYRSIIENSLYAFLQTIPGTCIQEANPAATEMFGYTLEEFRQLGHKVLDDENDPGLLDFQKIRNRDGRLSRELTGIRKNGERFPCHVSSAIYTDTEGNKINSMMIIDITERKNAEEKIRTSEEQFRGAFDYSAIGMAIFTIDGRCKRTNQSLCDMLGYGVEELTSLRFDEITHPEDLPLNIKLLNELTDGKRDSYHMEKRYLHKDGTPVWVLLGVSIIRDANGDPIHFISQIQDISRIKATEHALAVSEEKYRKIFENIQDIYYRTDGNGIITEISPSIERYDGYTRSNVIGSGAADFYYYKADRDRIVEALRKNESVIDFEVKLRSKNSELLYASVNARLIIENGVIQGSEGSIRDITQRKLQENELTSLNTELRALNIHRERLLSVIGHDLRNPVAASHKLAELALMDVAEVTKAELLEYMARIETGLSSANGLLEELLLWAKNQFNSLGFQPVHIDDLKEDLILCLQRMMPMAEAKGINLSANVDDGIALTADKEMLDTVIRNLVSNAIKFTASGSVLVSASRCGTEVFFAVKDTGSGIPDWVISELFNRSTHYSTYGTSGEKGTGLGLEICRDFVEKHNGKIWAESREGEGSTFYFTIPL